MAGLGRFIPPGLGWQPDLPDPRDFTLAHHAVREQFAHLPCCVQTPQSADLRVDDRTQQFSTVDNQGTLNSSAAFACTALVEYFERRSLGRTFEGSALFLHEMTQKPGQSAGASGIRSTIKALVRYGIPPEEFRPYTDTSIAAPSDLRLLGYSSMLSDAVYFRIDPPRQHPSLTLQAVKSIVAAGFPVIFGFSVPQSVTERADIMFRPGFDSYRGGQTVLAVGFDDRRFGKSDGALLFRNSWGTVWGDEGYGWLPYAFVEHHCAADFWTLLRSEWLDPNEYDRPVICR